MSIPHIRGELLDAHAINLTESGIANYIQRYQTMLAARQQDPEALRRHYESIDTIILSIDGLQPEKGHETLYVVRELNGKRVWFAEALLSAAAAEVQRLIAQAKAWAERLNKPVVLWISDKQEAFVTGIAVEFPGVPHRYCANHFLRDLAKPVLEADSHAKVQMRQKVRGLRGIERSVLELRRNEPLVSSGEPSVTETVDQDHPLPVPNDPAGDVVLDYCAAVRGILNNDQGGPLIRPGCRWRMLSMRCVRRSNETWTRKKGVRGDPTAAVGRLHRHRVDAGEAPAGSDPGSRRDDRGDRCDPGSYPGRLRHASGRL
jgi:hypothetical protein